VLTKDFHQRFGIDVDRTTTEKKFVTRAEIAIFEWLKDHTYIWVPDYVNWVSEELGEDWHRHIYDSNQGKYIASSFKIRQILGSEFFHCLKLIEVTYVYVQKPYIYGGRDKAVRYLDSKIPELLDKSETNLNIFWKDGKFYPSGDKLLDKELVIDVLDGLNAYPDEKADFDKALKAFMPKRYSEAVSNCYNCAEGVVNKILGNKKTLTNNIKDLLKTLKLSQEWKSILVAYVNCANKHGRHATEGRHKIDPKEAEAFIYMTGLIVRLCIGKEQ